MKNLLFNFYQFIIFKKRKFPESPLKILNRLNKSQYWSREQTQQYQLTRLKGLIENARTNTDYYGSLPKLEIESIDQFHRDFPKLTKSLIVKNRDLLKNRTLFNNHRHTTSGTTGQPVTFEVSPLAEAHRIARIMRFYSWWDIKPSDRNVLIWGFKKTQSFTNLQKLSRWFRRRLEINVFDINKETLKDFVLKIEQFNPTYLRGYTTALTMLAELMEEENIRFKNVKLKVAIVTGEILHDNARKLMEEVFECKIANEYGSSDCGLYAQECPEGSMHINEEQVLLYTDDSNKVYATELENTAMPIVNYINNDHLIISENLCSCGRTSRLVEKIEGRVSDLIILPNGSKKNPAIFYYIIQELSDIGHVKAVKQYKVYRSENKFMLRVVPDINFVEEVLDYIQKRMIEELGEGAIVETEVVEKIDREKSGKLKNFEKISY